MEGLAPLVPAVERIAARITGAVRGGGTVYWFGNGGSATQAQHFATELVCRFEADRAGIPSVALTADPSLLTALANDYSFDTVFARQVEALCRPGDVVCGLSTSGNSSNVLQGIDAANTIGAFTVGLSGGDGGKLARAAEVALVVPHARTCRIQEAHLFLGHVLCELVEQAIVAEADGVRPT